MSETYHYALLVLLSSTATLAAVLSNRLTETAARTWLALAVTCARTTSPGR